MNPLHRQPELLCPDYLNLPVILPGSEKNQILKMLSIQNYFSYVISRPQASILCSGIRLEIENKIEF